MSGLEAQSKPRIACVTLYDRAFASIGWMCRTTLTRYGRLHGYDVITADSVDCDRPAPWHKVRFARALFDEGYDFVFWVDADAVVADFRPDVAGLIRPDKDLHLVRHEFDGFPAPVANTGVFLIRNCDWSRDLLDRMWALDQYAEATWWENAAFIHLLGGGFDLVGIPEGDRQIDENRIDWITDRWNRVHIPMSPGRPIIRHYAGRAWRRRVLRMPTWLNPPRTLLDEATARPTPLDLTHHGVVGAKLHHDASRPHEAAPRRAA